MIKIRIARQTDAEDIKKITEKAFSKYIETVGIKTTAALLETVDDIKKDILEKQVLVLENDGVVSGSLRLEITGNKAYLSRFGVVVNGYGYGDAMLKFAENLLKKNAVSEIWLHTAVKAESLIKFYKRNGFEICSVSDTFGYDRALMKKVIKNEFRL